MKTNSFRYVGYRQRTRPAQTRDVSARKNTLDSGFFNAVSSVPFFHPTVLQRKCDHCAAEEKKQDKEVQRKTEAGITITPAVSAIANPGPAQPLPAAMRRFFNRALGYDFSGVAIHEGTQADKAAKSIRAKAFTLGNHVVFAAGQYQPETLAGKKLLAHELTHVMQQQGAARLSRKPTDTTPLTDTAPEQEETLGSVSTTGVGYSVPPKVAYGHCAGAHVSGRTDANYDQGNYSVSGASVRRATGCTGCAPAQCVTVSGAIASVFQANPSVTLPSVPAGNWNDCERTAIQNFIDTTLSQHEQQHVAAFNTYNGTVNTPFTYTGCQDGWEAHVANIHEGINRQRAAAANALSNALDANGANNFTITCNCPDPAPAPAKP